MKVITPQGEHVDLMTINVGPSHPATHGTLRILAALDGENIAACVTELPTIGTRKVCNVITVGGTRMEEWLGMSLSRIEQWATSNGCSAMRFPECRPGWQKILKDYNVTKINLEKAL